MDAEKHHSQGTDTPNDWKRLSHEKKLPERRVESGHMEQKHASPLKYYCGSCHVCLATALSVLALSEVQPCFSVQADQEIQ